MSAALYIFPRPAVVETLPTLVSASLNLLTSAVSTAARIVTAGMQYVTGLLRTWPLTSGNVTHRDPDDERPVVLGALDREWFALLDRMGAQ